MSKNQKPFQRPTRLEEIYGREIDRLLKKYFQFPDTATLGEITARLVEYGHAENFLKGFATTLAKRMITNVRHYNSTSWRQAAKESGHSRTIYQMLKRDLSGSIGISVDAMVRENAKLISTVPRNVSEILTKHIQTRFTEGIRSEQIAKEIRSKVSNLREFEVRRIARTEVAKTDTAITRARAEAIGLNWYQWETSEDQRVRKSHRKMDRVLISWNDAPAPETLVHERSQGHYHAGNIYNCRCVALPIVTLNEISFPARVYYNGQIKKLTRRQFVLISGMPLQIAA